VFDTAKCPFTSTGAPSQARISKNFRSMRSGRIWVVEMSAREYYHGILHRAAFISIQYSYRLD
jgi:hypothetical protein